jgi:DNA modification methylase
MADVKQRLAPGGGGGGGGAWLGGPRTASSDNYTATPAGLLYNKTPNYDGAERQTTGTSIFDPVLCELAYKWFCPPGGVVLDPFAGGSVRGIVAATLGYAYTGFELRPEQTAANRAQAARICPDNAPTWIDGDSAVNIPAWGGAADFVFSCPPYGNLEVYSDKPDDLSAMSVEGFDAAYRAIIAAAVAKLQPDRFACFVVGNYRDKRGFYVDLVGKTVAAFEDAGAGYYNEAVLVTAVGSLPIRVGKQFTVARKLGKTHQNVLVFCKGDPRKAARAIDGQ